MYWNPSKFIAFHVFLVWDRAYVSIACLSSEINLKILPDLFFPAGWAKEGATNSESFASSSTPNFISISTYFLNIV